MESINKVFVAVNNQNLESEINVILNQLGYSNIKIFESGEEVLNNLYKSPVIILLDFNLKGEKNGFEVLLEIMSFNPDIKVIFISEQRSIQTAVDTLKHGAFDYIQKDLAFNENLNSVLMRIIDLDKYIGKRKRNKKIKKTAITLVIMFALILCFWLFKDV